MSVVVISHRFDPTADFVVEELNRRNTEVFRFDTAEFPHQLAVSAALESGAAQETWTGTLRTASRQVGLREVSGVFYRRPTAFTFPASMDESARRWAIEEARIGFGGLLASLDTWLNHPHRVAFCEYKPAQLQVAAQCGLTIPKTLITNDPDEAHQFCKRVGEVIYKPLSAVGIDDHGEPRTIYATRVPDEDFGDATIRGTAHLFQEWIEHSHAVRVAVVDDEFFATAIHAHSDTAHIDWRSDYGALTYEPTSLPGEVRHKTRDLMQRLGLRFGAIDFLVQPDGTHVYLETNSNGQWAFVDEAAPQIASAIATALMKGPPR